jgi:hypothetical protein
MKAWRSALPFAARRDAPALASPTASLAVVERGRRLRGATCCGWQFGLNTLPGELQLISLSAAGDRRARLRPTRL